MDKHDKYNDLSKEIEELKDGNRPHGINSILHIISNADFQALQKRWFTPKPSQMADMHQIDYPKEVADYVLGAIRLYRNAVSHEAIFYIELHFYQDISADIIQPQIDILFNTGLWHIDIGMLWDCEIGLDRERKKDCQTMAETVWYEYKDKHDKEAIFLLADRVKEMVQKEYSEVDVRYKIT